MVIKLLTAHASVRKYKNVTLTKKEVYELIQRRTACRKLAFCPSILCHSRNG